MQLIVVAYSVYIALSVALTIWVAQTLFKRGRTFLIDCFRGNTDLADSINHLLVVGFYLINFGYIALALKQEGDIETSRVLIEMLATKMGLVSLVLGFMHFMNLAILNSSRRHIMNRQVQEERYAAAQTLRPPRMGQ